MKKVLYLALSLGLLVLPVACKKAPKKEAAAAGSSKMVTQFDGPDAVVARIDDISITQKEVDEHMQAQLYAMHERIYRMKLDAIEELVSKKLLKEAAEKQKLSPDALLDNFVKDKVTVSEEEIAQFYEHVKDNPRLQGSDEEKRAKIKDYLIERKRGSVEAKFYADLKKDHKVEIFLEEPPLPEVKVEVGDDPVVGPEDAAITIVEFSDFQCPHCARMAETLEKLIEEYKGKVRVVFKDFPLKFHENAMVAALASGCAKDQGKYFEYYKTLYKNNQALDVESLKKYAKDLGMDAAAFDECLTKEKYKAEIENDLKEGAAAGINSTPTLIINGKLLAGGRQADAIKAMIDKELGAKAKM